MAINVAIVVAHHLALISQTRQGMQALFSDAEHDASERRYLFSGTTTKLEASKHACLDADVILNNTPIGLSEEEGHLGIQSRADLSNKSDITARITAARSPIYALMGAGLHSLNGLSSVTFMQLIDTYVLRTLLYGLECLVLKTGRDTTP